MDSKSESIWDVAGVDQESFFTAANLIVVKHGKVIDVDALQDYGVERAPRARSAAHAWQVNAGTIRDLEDETHLDVNMDHECKTGDDDSEDGEIESVISEADADVVSRNSDTGMPTEVAKGYCKRRFLDHLAQLASCSKGGHGVASSAMSETQRKTTVWLTKNSQFSNWEVKQLGTRLPNIIGRLSRFHKNNQKNTAEQELWKTILLLVRSRTCTAYGPWYEECVTHFLEHLLGVGGLDIENQAVVNLEKLQRSCQNLQSPSPHTEDVIITASMMHKDHALKRFLHESPAAKKGRGHKVWQSICFLGRARVLFVKLCEIVPQLPNLEVLEVHCIAHTSPSGEQRPLSISLDHGRQSCGIKHPQDIISTSPSRRRYEKLKNATSQVLYVHAEIQLLWHLLGRENLVRYIGGSKYCCVLCHLFLADLGFVARKCHLKFYTKWTMPPTPPGSQLGYERFAQSLRNCYDRLKRILESPRLPNHVQACAESSAISASTKVQKTATRLSIEDWHNSQSLKRQQERQSSLADFQVQFRLLGSGFGSCRICHSPTARLCNICRDDWICSTHCERQYSERHPSQCLLKGEPSYFDKDCAVCGKEDAHICMICYSAAYCSPDCWQKDQRVHEMLCWEYAMMKRTRPAVSGDWRLAFCFPVDKHVPRVIHVQVEQQKDEEYGFPFSFHRARLSDLLGDDDPCTGKILIQRRPRQDKNLKRTISLFHRDAFLRDGSSTNTSVQRFVGLTKHSWRGPMIMMRQPGIDVDPRTYIDAAISDLTITCDYLSDYTRSHTEDPDNFHEPWAGPKTRCVRINCPRDMTLYGRPQFDERLKLTSELQHTSSWTSDIAHQVGVPLAVEYDALREEESDTNDIDLDNHAVSALSYDINTSGQSWGYHKLAIQPPFEVSGTFLAFRRDGQPLYAGLVEDIYHFCGSLQPFFEDAHGGSRIHRTKEEVMAMITIKKFQTFQRERKEKNLVI